MTRIKNNALLKGISGKLGETHSYRKVRGKMYMVNLPDTGKPATENQKLFTERFLKAANYGKEVMKDPEAKALYLTGITAKKHNAYLVALSDLLNAPRVHAIHAADYRGAVGDVISIDATDDFKVTRVRVIILDSDGRELERGEAIQDHLVKNTWTYTATVANPSVEGSTISVTAFDTPKNETTREMMV